ncbi:MAG: HI0074 family nucleotidyltransferase substrate-binding subunit [Pseudomonadota bacterium]
MDRYQIIRKVVEIILRHAKPERIWLYGSEASGESNKESDIDIAFEDESFRDIHLIKDDVEKLKTLVHVDVKNIVNAEERFKNRVKSTGRVLYSATKKLRAEDGLYNFSKACDRFADALDSKEQLYHEGFSEIFPDLMMKRFEFTFEMSWKAIKRYLSFVGIECSTPRSCFKEAFAQRLIGDEGVWLDMVEKRNLSAHIYDEAEIKVLLDRMSDYRKAFESLRDKLHVWLTANG